MISGGFYGPRGVLSDFEGGGGRILKEYSRTDLDSREHGGGGLSGSAVEYVEIKLKIGEDLSGQKPPCQSIFKQKSN